MNTSETIVGHGIFAVVKDTPILARHVMETLSTGDNEELEESLAFVKPAMGEIEKYDPETGAFEGHLLTSEQVLRVTGTINARDGYTRPATSSSRLNSASQHQPLTKRHIITNHVSSIR